MSMMPIINPKKKEIITKKQNISQRQSLLKVKNLLLDSQNKDLILSRVYINSQSLKPQFDIVDEQNIERIPIYINESTMFEGP